MEQFQVRRRRSATMCITSLNRKDFTTRHEQRFYNILFSKWVTKSFVRSWWWFAVWCGNRCLFGYAKLSQTMRISERVLIFGSPELNYLENVQVFNRVGAVNWTVWLMFSTYSPPMCVTILHFIITNQVTTGESLATSWRSAVCVGANFEQISKRK